MKKSKFKQLTKGLSGILLLSTLLISIISSSLSPTTNAEYAEGFSWDSDALPTHMRDLRWAYSIIECMHLELDESKNTAVPFGNYRMLSESEVDSFSFLSDSTKKLNVGFDIEKDDGIVSCREAASSGKKSIENLFGNTVDFIKIFYNFNTDSSAGPTNTYIKKELGNIGNYRSKSVFNTTDLRNAQFAAAAAQCIKEGTTFMPGKTNSSVIVVSKAIAPDRNLSCGTLIQKFRSDIEPWLQTFSGILDNPDEISLGVLRNNPQLLYDAISVKAQGDEFRTTAYDKLVVLFTSSPDQYLNCLVESDIVDSGSTLPPGWVADYLVGNTTDLDGDPDSDVKEESFKTCLERDYGAFYTDIIDQLNDDLDGIDASPNIPSAPAADTDTDRCLEGDSLLGWIVCPIVEKIQSTLGVLEDYINDMLKFDLAEAGGAGGTAGGTTQDEIRDSWNIFRSLASILIVIGFLTALTIKAIKGE